MVVKPFIKIILGLIEAIRYYRTSFDLSRLKAPEIQKNSRIWIGHLLNSKCETKQLNSWTVEPLRPILAWQGTWWDSLLIESSESLVVMPIWWTWRLPLSNRQQSPLLFTKTLWLSSAWIKCLNKTKKTRTKSYLWVNHRFEPETDWRKVSQHSPQLKIRMIYLQTSIEILNLRTSLKISLGVLLRISLEISLEISLGISSWEFKRYTRN